jgi:hypothetical protein
VYEQGLNGGHVVLYAKHFATIKTMIFRNENARLGKQEEGFFSFKKLSPASSNNKTILYSVMMIF